MKLKLQKPICVFDLETTGTNLSKDRIVEIAVTKLFPDGDKVQKHKYINPEIPIPAEAAEVHGITDEKVAGAPPFRRISKALFDFLSGCDFVGYNCLRFDIPLLVEEFHRVNLEHPFTEAKIVDVYKIFVKREARTLKAAFKFYCKQELEGAHSAHVDTEATLQVLYGQLQMYSDLACDVETLSGYCSDEGLVDYAGKIIRNDDGYCFNFGPHKGHRVLEHVDFARWMLNKDFSLDTKSWIKKILARQ